MFDLYQHTIRRTYLQCKRNHNTGLYATLDSPSCRFLCPLRPAFVLHDYYHYKRFELAK